MADPKITALHQRHSAYEQGCPICEDKRDLFLKRGGVTDQPPPIPQPERVPVWDLVLADCDHKPGPTWLQIRLDMSERDKLGRERYGTPLTTHNGRDHLVDAYQEGLDLAVYLRTEIEERKHTEGTDLARLQSLYWSHLVNLHSLRGLIDLAQAL